MWSRPDLASALLPQAVSSGMPTPVSQLSQISRPDEITSLQKLADGKHDGDDENDDDEGCEASGINVRN